MAAKFEVYPDKGGHYRWRLVSGNGQTTATSSETFSSHADAKRAAEGVEADLASVDVEHLTETLRLTVNFEDSGDGWILARVAEVPGAISQGRTRAEARENVIDALRTVLTPDEQLGGGAPGVDAEPLTLTIS